MKLLAIAGSIRSTSSTSALVRAAARLAPPGVAVEISVADVVLYCCSGSCDAYRAQVSSRP